MPDNTADSNPYDDLVTRLLDNEDAQQASLESRAASLITTAGAFITILFGITTFGHRNMTSLPNASIVFLGIGLALLVLSATVAVLVHQPLRTLYVDPDAMLDELRLYWGEPRQDAQIRIAATRARVLPTVRHANEKKAQFLRISTASQVSAMLTIAVAIILAL